jgi:predicted PurR-regulated permease PerM
VVGVGKVVLDLLASVVVVVIVTVYLLADLPRVRRGLYLLAPRSRRARMVLLTDEILDRVGGYVLGNLLTSFIAASGPGSGRLHSEFRMPRCSGCWSPCSI